MPSLQAQRFRRTRRGKSLIVFAVSFVILRGYVEGICLDTVNGCASVARPGFKTLGYGRAKLPNLAGFR